MEKLNIDILHHIVKFLDNKKCVCHNCEFDNLILCSKYYLETLKQFVDYAKPFTSEKYKQLLFNYNKRYLCPRHFANFTQKEIMAFEKIHDDFKEPTTISTFIHMETTAEMDAFIKKLDMGYNVLTKEYIHNMFIFTYSSSRRGVVFTGSRYDACCGGIGHKFIKRRRYEENDFSYDGNSLNEFLPEDYLQL